MRTTRRRLTQRKAPRLAGTERGGNSLLAARVIANARPVNGPVQFGYRHVSEILPGVFAQLVATLERKANS